MTAAAEPVVGACVVGFRDWTRREHCGQPSACEVRLLKAGRPASVWQAACAGHADGLQQSIAARGGGWVFEQRDPAWITELFDPPVAAVVPIHSGGSK